MVIASYAVIMMVINYSNVEGQLRDCFCFSYYSTEGSCKRHGYMGHLTKIANDLYKNMNSGPNQGKLTSLYNGMFILPIRVFALLDMPKCRMKYLSYGLPQF